MASPYTYITSSDFIDNLTFDYAETYSLQRGLDYEENLKQIKPDYDQLRIRKEHENDLTPTEEVRFSKLNELLGFTQYLINDKGEFHPSSKKTNTFTINDPIISRLTTILRTEAKEIPAWLCAPLYRDAIVFYNNQKKIISYLNICLDCQYMETKKFSHVKADYVTYDLLKRFFIDIGHDIENPTYSIIDNFNTLKKRYGRL